MKTEPVLQFLGELKENNHRDWMEKNKKVYEASRKYFEEMVAYLIKKTGEFDPAIVGLEPKNCLFRINRDIRFSKDKSPYKINFGASFQKGGKKTGLAGYYLHLQPEGETFVGGGIYMPENDVLMRIRQEIDYNLEEYKGIIFGKAFQSHFGEVWGEKMKNPPKGYAKDHPAIELLKLKSYTGFHQYSDEEVKKSSFIDNVVEDFKAMKPFIDFLNRAVEA